jgi:hypothetical protein
VVDSLLGPSTSPAYVEARRVIEEADRDLVLSIDRGVRLRGGEVGFVRALATAQREPAVLTVLRAITSGIQRADALPGPERAALLTCAQRLQATDVSPRDVADLLAQVSKLAPTLLVIDEFGKNLEHFSESRSGDLFVLQEIVERASGTRGLPVFVMTLQHLAFEEYLVSNNSAQRREWAKVQGRFEDIPFADSPAELVQLVGRVFHRTSEDPQIETSIRRWSEREFKHCDSLGLANLLGSAENLASAFPLHPLTLAASPELAARYGQRERTLFSFLARREPYSVPSFLTEALMGRNELPVVRLDRLYDYFVTNAGALLASSSGASRWLEISRHIREIKGLTDDEVRCLKTIGVLNLISTGGAFRCSKRVLAYALSAANRSSDERIENLLNGLVDRNLIIYREFADEYRLWRGTDFDLTQAVDAARTRLSILGPAEICERAMPLSAVVAAGHSQRSGTLRSLARHYLSGDVPGDSLAKKPEGHDGTIFYFVGDLYTIPPTPSTEDAPVLVARSSGAEKVTRLASDCVALQEVLSEAPELRDDWVARRELEERLFAARYQFRACLDKVFQPGEPGLTLTWVGHGEVDERSWSRVASFLCDRIYRKAPELHNEMIARQTLTSQGAKARRDLLIAMVSSAEQELLSLEGYGPERAMYEAVLREPGIHRDTPDGWRFVAPRRESSYFDCWQAIEKVLREARLRRVGVNEIYETLMSSPFGLRDGPVPLLLAAALLCHSEEIALYQDGSYQPTLGADVLERLIKAPDRFTLKYFFTTGSRRAVIAALESDNRLRRTISLPHSRNQSVVGLVAALVGSVRVLPAYAVRTTRLSARARGVRDQLLVATEPDKLLFESLPMAVELEPFRPNKSADDSVAREFARRLSATMRELSDLYAGLLTEIANDLSDVLAAPKTLPDLRTDLRSRARRLIAQVLEPHLRSFLLTITDENLEDDDWLEAVAMNVAERPPNAWRDDDLHRFRAHLHELVGAYRRIEALHFESLDAPTGTFVARRIAVTAPDAREVNTVVWIDERAAQHMSPIVDDAIGKATALLGSRGAEALLALAAQRLLGEAPRRSATSSNDETAREEQGA